MTVGELKNIIARGETLSVEFKSDRDKLSDRALVEAVISLANTDGGLLLQGVEDDGRITGLHAQHSGIGTPSAMIANRTVPPIHVAVEDIVIEGHRIFVIDVPRAAGLVGTSDGYYARRRLKPDGKPEAVPMNPYELQQRVSSLRLIDPSAQLMREVPLSAINPLQRERMRVAIRNNNHSDKTLLELDDEAFDLALGLVRKHGEEKYLTLAGVLFLAQEPILREHIPMHEIAFQVLKGTDVVVNDYMRLPLVEAFDNLMIRFRARVEEKEVMRGLYRMSAPNYDTTGFREALVNALVHRDFARMGTVIVRFDDTGLTISSPGGFVDGVTLDNLLTVEPSPRNALLADIAKRIGLAERTGRGIDRIFEGTIRYGRPRPDYSRTTGTSVVVFLVNTEPDFKFLEMLNVEEEKVGKAFPFDSLVVLAALREARRLSIEELARIVQKPKDTTRPVVEKLVERGFVERRQLGKRSVYLLSAEVYRKEGKNIEYVRASGFTDIEREQMVLKLISQKGFACRKDVMELCHVNKDAAYQILAKLRKNGEIVLVGQQKASRYVKSTHR